VKASRVIYSDLGHLFFVIPTDSYWHS